MAQQIIKTVTKTLFLGFLVIALLTNGFWFGLRYLEDRREFSEEMDTTITQFQSTVAYFVQQHDAVMIMRKIRAFMQNPIRSGIILYADLPDFTRTFGLLRDNGRLLPYVSGKLPAQTFFHKTTPLHYQGEPLGRITIYFDDQSLRRQFLSMLLYTIGTTLLFALTGSVLIYYRLRRILSTTFNDILQVLHALTKSDFHIAIPQYYTGEVGIIMHDLETMAITLERVIQELTLQIEAEHRIEHLTGVQALVFGNMQDGVIIMETDSRTIFDWNQGAERIFGYAKAEVVGQSYELLFPELQPAFLAPVFEKIRKFGSWAGRVTFLHRSQAAGICEMTIMKPILPKNQQEISILLVRDVTKEAETEALYEEVIELSPDPIFIVRDLNIVFANRALTSMLSYTKRDLQETPLTKVLFLDASGKQRDLLDMQAPVQRCVLKDRQHQYHAVEISQTLLLFHNSPARLMIARDLAERLTYEETLLEKISKIQKLTHAIADALENVNRLNDTSTGSHIHRIASYSIALAKHLDCDPQFLDDLHLYAPLHDVGKVALSDAILKKPGAYTDAEREEMKAHVTFGAQIVESIAGISSVAYNIVAYHHEWWDGSGYMEGLKGAKIPLEAQIVAIADTFDAIISSRVYKSAHTVDETIYLMRQESETHFDPVLLTKFFEVIDAIVTLYHRFQQANGIDPPQEASPTADDTAPAALDFRIATEHNKRQDSSD